MFSFCTTQWFAICYNKMLNTVLSLYSPLPLAPPHIHIYMRAPPTSYTYMRRKQASINAFSFEYSQLPLHTVMRSLTEGLSNEIPTHPYCITNSYAYCITMQTISHILVLLHGDGQCIEVSALRMKP